MSTHAVTNLVSGGYTTTVGAGATVTSLTFTNNGQSFTISGNITNGSNAPGTPLVAKIYISGDGGTNYPWRFYMQAGQGSLVSNDSQDWAVTLDASVMYARVQWVGGSNYGGTVSAEVQSIVSS